MREQIQPIYTELLTIMLNSELVQLTEEKTSEIIDEYEGDTEKEADFANNHWYIIRICNDGLIALSSDKDMYVLEDIHPDDLNIDFCPDYLYNKNTQTKREFITGYITDLLGEQNAVGQKEVVCDCWKVCGDIQNGTYVILNDDNNPVLFDYINNGEESKSTTIIEGSNLKDLHAIKEFFKTL